MSDEKPWKCGDCDERFSSFAEFYAHKIHVHGFKPTKYSHTMRYWRISHKPELNCQHCGGLIN